MKPTKTKLKISKSSVEVSNKIRLKINFLKSNPLNPYRNKNAESSQDKSLLLFLGTKFDSFLNLFLVNPYKKFCPPELFLIYIRHYKLII
jgi:hypothetical protein